MKWIKNKEIYLFLVIFIAILLLDQISKFMIRNKMRLYGSISVINNIFHITYVRNKGVAFGMMSNYHSAVLFIVPLSIIILMYLTLNLRKKNLWISIGIPMIFAGAVGNLIDRLRVGYVVDFIDIRFWPGIFNIADSSIVIGTFAFLIGMLKVEIIDGKLRKRTKNL